MQKFSRDHSSCVRPGLPAYATSAETATFTLEGDMAGVTSLNLWHTHFAYYPGDTTVEFVQVRGAGIDVENRRLAPLWGAVETHYGTFKCEANLRRLARS